MEGPVYWPLLLALTGLIIAVSGVVAALIIKGFMVIDAMKRENAEENKKTRHAINSEIAQGRVAFEMKLEEIGKHFNSRLETVDARLRTIEREHALVVTLRQDFKDFQSSILDQISQNREERREDMRNLHARINDILMIPNPRDPHPPRRS